MNGGMKAALTNSKLNCCIYVRAALFHSTPALDRKRRSCWEPRSNHYSGRTRRNQAKQTLLRNANAYADLLFQTMRSESFEDEPSSSKGTSWFKKQYSAKGSKKNWGRNQGGWNSGRRGFEFLYEDEDVETIFRSMFGGNKFYSWSFINEDYSRWSSSNYSNHGRSSNWRRRYEEEYQSESESESTESGERLALGLSASGPLTLEDVKNAYRVSALKYHPDRHQGSSKTAAEEKFKLCSAAYRSLCDKFGVNGPCSKSAKAQRC